MPDRISTKSNKARSGLDSGLDVIELLASQRETLSLKSIADALGMSKSGVHSVLATLTRRGYVERAGRTGYRLGMKAWDIAGAAPGQDLTEVAAPHMSWLAGEISEGVILGKRDGADVVYLHLIESAQTVRVHASVGERIPAHCTSTGLALLSTLSNEEVRALLPARLTCFTPETLATRDDIIRELDVVRRRGYAVNRGGWRLDVGGISVCVRDEAGTTVGALCVALPLYRLTRKWLAMATPLVAEAAVRVGRDVQSRRAMHHGVEFDTRRRA